MERYPHWKDQHWEIVDLHMGFEDSDGHKQLAASTAGLRGHAFVGHSGVYVVRTGKCENKKASPGMANGVGSGNYSAEHWEGDGRSRRFQNSVQGERLIVSHCHLHVQPTLAVLLKRGSKLQLML